jgi:hypothetical protein
MLILTLYYSAVIKVRQRRQRYLLVQQQQLLNAGAPPISFLGRGLLARLFSKKKQQKIVCCSY